MSETPNHTDDAIRELIVELALFAGALYMLNIGLTKMFANTTVRRMLKLVGRPA